MWECGSSDVRPLSRIDGSNKAINGLVSDYLRAVASTVWKCGALASRLTTETSTSLKPAFSISRTNSTSENPSQT